MVEDGWVRSLPTFSSGESIGRDRLPHKLVAVASLGPSANHNHRMNEPERCWVSQLQEREACFALAGVALGRGHCGHGGHGGHIGRTGLSTSATGGTLVRPNSVEEGPVEHLLAVGHAENIL